VTRTEGASLRSLEIETEAQILHKHEDEGPHLQRVRSARTRPLFPPSSSTRGRWPRRPTTCEHSAAAGESRQWIRKTLCSSRRARSPSCRTGSCAHAWCRSEGVTCSVLATHRAPGGRRDRQARRAHRRGRLRRISTRQVLERMLPPVRAHAAQRRGARIEKTQERVRRGKPDTWTHFPRAASRRRGSHGALSRRRRRHESQQRSATKAENPGTHRPGT